MRYSNEPMTGYGFLSFAKNICTHATKVAKSMSNKYKLLQRKQFKKLQKQLVVSLVI